LHCKVCPSSAGPGLQWFYLIKLFISKASSVYLLRGAILHRWCKFCNFSCSLIVWNFCLLIYWIYLLFGRRSEQKLHDKNMWVKKNHILVSRTFRIIKERKLQKTYVDDGISFPSKYHENDGAGIAVTSHVNVPFPFISICILSFGGLPLVHFGKTEKSTNILTCSNLRSHVPQWTSHHLLQVENSCMLIDEKYFYWKQISLQDPLCQFPILWAAGCGPNSLLGNRASM